MKLKITRHSATQSKGHRKGVPGLWWENEDVVTQRLRKIPRKGGFDLAFIEYLDWVGEGHSGHGGIIERQKMKRSI